MGSVHCSFLRLNTIKEVVYFYCVSYVTGAVMCLVLKPGNSIEHLLLVVLFGIIALLILTLF